MTKLIPILSGRCLVLELPEGANRFTVFNDDRPYLSFFVSTETPRVYLPEGNWRIIGMLSEVTNAELADVTGFYYNKYNERYVEMPTSAMRATPIGDIEDAILAEGYYLDENPIEYPSQSDPKFYDEPYDGTGFYQEIYSSAIEDWQAAQPRVLDRSRCLLLGRAEK